MNATMPLERQHVAPARSVAGDWSSRSAQRIMFVSTPNCLYGRQRQRKFTPFCIKSSVQEITQEKSTSALLLSVLAGKRLGSVRSTMERQTISNLCRLLEQHAGDDDAQVSFPRKLNALDGWWRLCYTSGSVPPLTLGVFQEVDVATRTLRNIVELPVPMNPSQMTCRIRLYHKFNVVGTERIRIALESIDVRWGAGDRRSDADALVLPSLPVPQLGDEKRGIFTTRYLNRRGLRISRGDRGELRVFIREFLC